MEKNPFISVIVPNYNYAQYLSMRIESILDQTFTDFELILLDDASTDESVSILENYRHDKHVSHIVINEQNTGSPFKQWMKGILLSRGKYIWIAEADDLAKPDFLETCVHSMQGAEDVSICYTGSLLINSNGQVSRKDVNHWGHRTGKTNACFDGTLFATHNLYWKNYIINASGAIFSRSKAITLLDSSFQCMRYCGDWLFWFEMSMKGQVIEVYKSLNYFRQHPAKVTENSRKAGEGVKEDILIVKHMEDVLGNRLSCYKKLLRHGLLYRKIRRLPIRRKQKAPLYQNLRDTLHSGFMEYLIERSNQYQRLLMPTLITSQRDRL